ncbi:hypothetical protein AGOR_G00087050 [Albula goreensis]|uniref:Uncharacterized protein n=1 Tax=Albula goreensis TaxID=1534307 RepID=A0A8T3DU79_9TELE|nr:hypothetical protein AGOR_G00087050 [Albula goreensis]
MAGEVERDRGKERSAEGEGPKRLRCGLKSADRALPSRGRNKHVARESSRPRGSQNRAVRTRKNASGEVASGSVRSLIA